MKRVISFLICFMMISFAVAASGLFAAFAYTDDDIYAYDVDRTKTKVCVSEGT